MPDGFTRRCEVVVTELPRVIRQLNFIHNLAVDLVLHEHELFQLRFDIHQN